MKYWQEDRCAILHVLQQWHRIDLTVVPDVTGDTLCPAQTDEMLQALQRPMGVFCHAICRHGPSDLRELMAECVGIGHALAERVKRHSPRVPVLAVILEP